MPWKWEHQKSTDFISKGMKVLEVGCAEGQFLSRVSKEKDKYLGNFLANFCFFK